MDLTIRLLEAEDRDALRLLPSRVSPESAISRFHGALATLSEPLLDRLLDVEVGQREAVIALDSQGIAGVARYARDEPTGPVAEVAVLVADEWQHHGVAHRMLDLLITRALAAGITELRADMFVTNVAARRLMAEFGRVLRSQTTGGHVILTVDIARGGGTDGTRGQAGEPANDSS